MGRDRMIKNRVWVVIWDVLDGLQGTESVSEVEDIISERLRTIKARFTGCSFFAEIDLYDPHFEEEYSRVTIRLLYRELGRDRDETFEVNYRGEHDEDTQREEELSDLCLLEHLYGDEAQSHEDWHNWLPEIEQTRRGILSDREARWAA